MTQNQEHNSYCDDRFRNQIDFKTEFSGNPSNICLEEWPPYSINWSPNHSSDQKMSVIPSLLFKLNPKFLAYCSRSCNILILKPHAFYQNLYSSFPNTLCLSQTELFIDDFLFMFHAFLWALFSTEFLSLTVSFCLNSKFPNHFFQFKATSSI